MYSYWLRLAVLSYLFDLFLCGCYLNKNECDRDWSCFSCSHDGHQCTYCSFSIGYVFMICGGIVLIGLGIFFIVCWRKRMLCFKLPPQQQQRPILPPKTYAPVEQGKLYPTSPKPLAAQPHTPTLPRHVHFAEAANAETMPSSTQSDNKPHAAFSPAQKTPYPAPPPHTTMSTQASTSEFSPQNTSRTHTITITHTETVK